MTSILASSKVLNLFGETMIKFGANIRESGIWKKWIHYEKPNKKRLIFPSS